MKTQVSPRTLTKVNGIIGDALKMFNKAFEPFVKEQLRNHFKGETWELKVKETLNKMDSSTDYSPNTPIVYDTQMLLFMMTRCKF
jgi:hypothetical protein